MRHIVAAMRNGSSYRKHRLPPRTGGAITAAMGQDRGIRDFPTLYQDVAPNLKTGPDRPLAMKDSADKLQM
ncbi:hypothetical protein CV103_06775 [Sphingomonas fennica]|uniref:Uncharacterized protein n=1 Tax=Edaphosphingomonas fennica TaxID=114404 RepID=A0A2T4I5C7_9SPHN|nr:hypothetical protein CV103_06775 [Sphingomonas fennica]